VAEARKDGGTKLPDGNHSVTEAITDFSEDQKENNEDDHEEECNEEERDVETDIISDKSNHEVTLSPEPAISDRSDPAKKLPNPESSEELESRPEAMAGRLAPLGGPGAHRKALPPLQKMATLGSPLGSMDKPTIGSLDKPTIGSLDKPKLGSLGKPTIGSLDKPKLGSLEKQRSIDTSRSSERGAARSPAREAAAVRKQSSLESLGWRPPGREEGHGSPSSSLLSGSSLGARGSFLKARTMEPEEDEEDEEEDRLEEEDEEEEASPARVRGILRGSPSRAGDQRQEGSR
jgi:hypothetical protein